MVRSSALAVLRLIITSYLGGPLDRQISRFFAFENAASVNPGAAERVRDVRSVARETAFDDGFALKVSGRQWHGGPQAR